MYQRVNVRSEVGNYLQSFPKAIQRNKWTMGRNIGVLIVQGLDVSNFFKDVPNFMKDVPNFIKDVPSGPKSIPK